MLNPNEKKTHPAAHIIQQEKPTSSCTLHPARK